MPSVIRGDDNFDSGDIDAGLGSGQTWYNLTSSRTAGTVYQNTTGKAIQVCMWGNFNGYLEVSSDNSTYIWVSRTFSGSTPLMSAIIPDNYYYYVSGTSGTLWYWAELR